VPAPAARDRLSEVVSEGVSGVRSSDAAQMDPGIHPVTPDESRIDPAGLAVGRRRRVWTISPAVRSLTGYDTRSSKSPSLAPLMNASISALV